MEAVDLQELKRYELATKDEGCPYMLESEFGDYVLHSDHLAEVESLRKQLEEAADKSLKYATKYSDVIQAITDPENQPSQYGTVPLAQYNSLRSSRDAEIERAIRLVFERLQGLIPYAIHVDIGVAEVLAQVKEHK